MTCITHPEGRKATVPRNRRAGRRILPGTLLCLAILFGSLIPEARAADSIFASLDATAQGQTAWTRGDEARAIAYWEEACRLDPQSIPPRLALARALLTRAPEKAVERYREAVALGMTRYSAQHWAVAQGILAFLYGGTLGACLLMCGLIARHVRAVHHTVLEALDWALRAPRWSSAGAIVALALPLLMNLGLLVTLLFWLFLCSFRFSRRERMTALGVAAWVLLLGPASLATTAVWSPRVDGHDAALIDEVQRHPAAAPSAVAARDWLKAEPDCGAALYLQALGRLECADAKSALPLLERAGSTGEIPPPVLACELGNAWVLNGHPTQALAQYAQAIELDRSRFEPPYNLGLLQASQGRFPEADQAMDHAARIDLDRLRELGRVTAGTGPRPPIPALWSARELWALTLRSPSRALPPDGFSALLPMRSLTWTGPLGLAAALLGFFIAGRLARLLRAHICYQCGRPVCRRCLIRVDRRAYCRECGETLSAVGLVESTRLLIRRLLEDKPAWPSRVWQLFSAGLPGIGATLRGHPEIGAVSSFLAGVGLALIRFHSWGRPLLPLPSDPATLFTLRAMGWILLVAALSLTTLGVQWAENRQKSLKVFLDRDVDRLAA